VGFSKISLSNQIQQRILRSVLPSIFKQLLWLGLMCQVCLSQGQAAMTLLHRELFETAGVMTEVSPGENFHSFKGKFYQRAGGPHLEGAVAARVDLRLNGQAAFGKFLQESADEEQFFFGAWFFVKSLESNSAVRLSVSDTAGNPGPVISEKNGQLGAGILYNSWTALPVDPSNRWIYFGIAVKRSVANTGTVRFYYRFPGQDMQSWAPINEDSIGIGSVGQFMAGCDGNNVVSKLRLGAPSLYTFDEADFSDIQYPQDLLEPETGLTWYCDPAQGDDENDGTTPEKAWKTAAKINEESYYVGLFTSSSPIGGDRLIINTSGAMLDLKGVTLDFRTAGLDVRAADGQEWIKIKSYRNLPASGWEVTNMPNVYATTDTQLHIVAWENDRFMHHPTGGTLADVQAFIVSTPGSFWTDGNILYLHPFDNTDPRIDGKRYDRSYNYEKGSAVALTARDMSIRDLHVGKTCLAVKYDNDPVSSYCLGTSAPMGLGLIKHCYLYYGSKHNLGMLQGGTGDYVIIDDVQAEQGSPYVGPGGQTVFVSFNSNPTVQGIVYSFRNCRSISNAGLIGSDQGVMTSYYPVFYSHNLGEQGEPNQFARFEFINCDFSSGLLSGGGVYSIYLEGTQCGSVNFSGDIVAERCKIEGMIYCQAGYSLEELNCFHVLAGILNRESLVGTVTLKSCTFDARNITSILGGVFNAALFNRTGPLDLTFQNNLIILPSMNVQANVFSDFEASDILILDHNAYSLGGNNFMYHFYDSSNVEKLSLSEWKALGYDEASLSISGTDLLNQGMPIPNSPLINAGLDMGPGQDFSGAMFEIRDDIGAFETPPATFEVWQIENFAEELETHPEIASGNVSYLNDGITNLEKYFYGMLSTELRNEENWAIHIDVEDPESALFEIRMKASRYQTDVNVSIQHSVDLKNWTLLSVWSEEIVLLSPTIEELVYQLPIDDFRRGFYRVRFSLN